MQNEVSVRVPATTANLGPGFDSLALALDLWNVATFQMDAKTLQVTIEGEGAGLLPVDDTNLIVKAARAVYTRVGRPFTGLKISCQNGIPLSSGLGSSAATILTGLSGANALLGGPLEPKEILDVAARMEGHPDNVAAALYGGLVIAAAQEECGWMVQRIDLPAWKAALALPAMNLPTHTARAALPDQVSMKDAVFNLSRTALVVEALRSGDAALLGRAMVDRLHQPYRLPLIPGASEAITAARQAGACAAALSGAGPSVIAFSLDDPAPAAQAMQAAFLAAGQRVRTFSLQFTNRGAEIR